MATTIESGIYKITTPSGKVYIGQSWNIHKRITGQNKLSVPMRYL